MGNGFSSSIIILLVVLVVVIILFAGVDKFLKGGVVKKSPEKKTASKPVVEEKTVKEPTKPKNENPTVPVMKIYNSELADDLNAMLKETDSSKSSRLQIENHINRASHISQYIHDKNYHSFDFGNETEDADEVNETLTFNRDDYKRFMALSNIEDKK